MEKKQEVEISNMDTYLALMQKGMQDKLFFVKELFSRVDTFVDFGCADGSLLRSLRELNAASRLIGYDISQQMLEIARANAPGIDFFSDWADIHIDFSHSCLILSSVIHEVYSYSSPEEIRLFWQRVFGSGFQYIVIRDMMFTESEDRPVAMRDKNRIIHHEEYAWLAKSFEEVNGVIDSTRQMLHFLLKYQYSHNWEREVRENYLPISLEELLAKIPDNYARVYFSHETLPYIADCVKRDFGISLGMKTHAKIILEHTEAKEDVSRAFGSPAATNMAVF
ncbi:MAG: class I SAM-dependent methyltransferase [Aristaeellaceae bacterium]